MFITEKYFRARFSNVCNVVVKRCCLEREKCYEIGTTSKRDRGSQRFATESRVDVDQ